MMVELDRFEGYRFIGDKRTQVVYDLEHPPPAAVLDELLKSEQFICFGPDMLSEARNRGYQPHRLAAIAAQLGVDHPAPTE
ncbi:MAG: hypothetical protein JOZ99_03155 [Actinobacteria bacterium]|nr:hypothetical protein [Actinomycetota bacterium]